MSKNLLHQLRPGFIQISTEVKGQAANSNWPGLVSFIGLGVMILTGLTNPTKLIFPQISSS